MVVEMNRVHAVANPAIAEMLSIVIVSKCSMAKIQMMTGPMAIIIGVPMAISPVAKMPTMIYTIEILPVMIEMLIVEVAIKIPARTYTMIVEITMIARTYTIFIEVTMIVKRGVPIVYIGVPIV
jgi:membrane-associated HD superfamily phosphohydrolase